ncbi:MAG: twin-arginine translocase subunit TatC [Pseudomonadota bacterium]
MTEQHIDDSSAPLIEHLAELRNRLMWSIGALVVMILAIFPFAQAVLEFLTAPACDVLVDENGACKIIATDVHGIFFTHVSVSIFGGFCAAFPFIAFQLWRFVAPGLYKSEQSAFLPFLIASPLLFIAGASFAYYAAMPLAMDFFIGYQQKAEDAANLDLSVLPDIRSYLRLAMKFIIVFGLCFQLPVALTLMGKAGLCTSDGLKRNRKYAIVGILVVAAIATPPDVFSQILLFAVVYGLYEGSIFLVRLVEKKREERWRDEGYEFDDDDLDDDEDWDDDDVETDPEAGEDRDDKAP